MLIRDLIGWRRCPEASTSGMRRLEFQVSLFFGLQGNGEARHPGTPIADLFPSFFVFAFDRMCFVLDKHDCQRGH